jgi:hypothetical protein
MNFRDLKVNTDKQILWVSGESVNDPSLLVDVDAITEDIEAIADALTPKDTIALNLTISDSIAPTIDCSADTVCTVTVTGDNGETEKVEIPKDSTGNIADAPIVITDNEGNSVVIDENGNVTIQKKESTGTDNVEQRKNKPFYSIEGHKFYSGETIFLPKSKERYKIEAYKDSTTKFDGSSVWSSTVEVIDSATANYIPDITSSDINGSILSTTSHRDTLRCNIVVVDVRFEEDPSQKWGFDENNKEKEDLYQSYREGIPWKSLKKDGDDEDVVKVIVLPLGAENKVSLFTSNPLITVGNLTSNSGSVSLSSRADSGYVGVKIDNFISDSMRLNIAAYELKTVDIKIVNIDEENDDVQAINFGDMTTSETTPVVLSGNNRFLDTSPDGDDSVVYRPTHNDSVIIAGPNKMCDSRAYNINTVSTNLSLSDFETTINNIYKQAVVKVNITYDTVHKVINYDLNKDGMFESNSPLERNTVFQYFANERDVTHLCIIDYPSENNQNGRFGFHDAVGIFHYRKDNGTTNPTVYKTAAHELGHGVFKLDHPFHDVRIRSYPRRPTTPGSVWTEKDPNTIMEWSNANWPRDKVRKYHWDDLRDESSNPNDHSPR